MPLLKSPVFIVNADDFGMNENVNRAIVDAFDLGLISSTTIMANMPAFEAACDLARQRQLNGRIGVHLNISEGKPLTEPIKAIASFCDSKGAFQLNIKRYSLSLPRDHMNALYLELKAQIEAVIRAGIQPTHLDSHHHDHTIWAVGTQVLALAKEFGIPAVRLSTNVQSTPNFINRIYKALFNARLRLNNMAQTRWFGNLIDVENALARLDVAVEIVVHPKYDEDGTLVDVYGRQRRPLAPAMAALGIEQHMQPYGRPAT